MSGFSISRTIMLLCILIMILVGYFGLWPLISSLKNVNTQVGTVNYEIEKTQEKIDTLRFLSEEVKKETAKIQTLGLAVPKTADLPTILIQMDTMANAAGVEITSITPSSSSVQAAASALPAGQANTPEISAIDMSIKGNYVNAIAFLEQLEKNLRPMSLSRINLAGSENKDAQSKTSLITIDTSFNVIPLTLGAAAPTPAVGTGNLPPGETGPAPTVGGPTGQSPLTGSPQEAR